MSNVLVIGAGKSGVAAANYLARRGSSVAISDPKEEALLLLASELDPSVRTAFGDQHANFPEGIDLVVLSPGVPPG
ncbi:MAG TPA: NAD-binding protein, partial [Thermoanaerobaculia bacterium]|nr:NAD-binding protein [Thermoanaerobaculia bacterium]